MATDSLTDGARRQLEECPICNDVTSNVAVLPCTHALCSDCFKKLCRSQQSGEMVTCPLCRSNFSISSTGSPVAMDTCEHSLVTDIAAMDKKTTNCSKTGTSYCIVHPEKGLVVFCFTCLKPSCFTCYIDQHRDHDIKEINVAAENLRHKLKDYSVNLHAKLSAYKDVANQIEMNKQQCVRNCESLWHRVTEAKTTLQATAASHGEELHQHIIALKRDKFSEYGHAKSKTEQRILELETFLDKCDFLTRDGTSFDVVHEFESMDVTVAHLNSKPFAEMTEDAQCVFKPTNVESYLPKTRSNLIGDVYSTEKNCASCSDNIDRQDLGEQLKFVVAERQDLGEQLKLLVAENKMLKSSSKRENKGSILFLICAIALAWPASLHGVRQYCANDHKDESFRNLVRLRRARNNQTLYATSTGTFVTAIPLNLDVTAMTSLNEVMFAAGPADNRGEQTRISAYNMSTFSLTESIVVQQRITDLVSGEQCNCLYFACLKSRQIFKASLQAPNSLLAEASWISWSVPGQPTSVSVNLMGNVIVTFYESTRLAEYTSTGELVREISLPSNISSPQQVVELDVDKFVVIDDHTRVCVVDAVGQLLYHTHPSLFSYVQHIAVNGFIFVADFPNERVKLLTSSLSHVRDVLIGVSPSKVLLINDSTLVILTREKSFESFKHIVQVFTIL